jgi:GTP-binding protein YchF
MDIALVGPPLSGKSTLFQAVSGHAAGHTGGETRAAVKVPDPRVDWLSEKFKSKKTTYATFNVLDLPGLSQETPSQQAEFRRHLGTLRSCDGLVAVVRAFESAEVPAYRDRVDPVKDVQELREEMMFADLEQVANRIERLRKQLTKPVKTQEQDKRELDLLERCQKALESDMPLSEVLRDPEEAKMLSSFGFLTQKPLLVVLNVAETDAAKPVDQEMPYAAATIKLSAKLEADLSQLSGDDQKTFLEEYGLAEPVRGRFLRACMQAIGLISFLTCGEDESRAWPIRNGTTAVDAAGTIHSDLARGFIRAETVAFEDLKAAGDLKTAKAQAKVRLEGKDYVVKDGDVLNIRFSV